MLRGMPYQAYLATGVGLSAVYKAGLTLKE